MVIGVKETATPTTRATLVSCFRVRKDRISRSRSSSYERETSQSFLSGACGLRDHHQSNSYYGEAYADPRCEMKKRQQQEIVVSGLTINTSDISSGEEEDNGGRGGGGRGEQFLLSSNSKMMPDESGILMSLIEPSVRKIGGGGAVSLSAFQVRSNLDHEKKSPLPNLLLIAFWGPKLNCCIS